MNYNIILPYIAWLTADDCCNVTAKVFIWYRSYLLPCITAKQKQYIRNCNMKDTLILWNKF